MTFHCAHRGFTAAINDPDWGYLGRGNVMSNTQSSTYVRPATETVCNGRVCAPGQLRNFDLAFFNGAMPPDVARDIRAHSETAGLIVYRFFHYRGRLRVEHGWLITTRDHKFLRSFVTGPTWRSADAVAHASLAIIQGS